MAMAAPMPELCMGYVFFASVALFMAGLVLLNRDLALAGLYDLPAK